jgi:acyl carrier protein
MRGFISEELNWQGTKDELTDDYPLIENKVVDSLGIFNIVSFVEDEFGIEIQDDELVPANFGSIEAISQLVDSKRNVRD